MASQHICRENIKAIFQLCAADITVAVLFLYIGKYSISTVSSCYNGASEGFWQAHYRIPSPIPPHPPTPNISSHYLIDLLAFVTKSCGRSLQSTSDRFPILDQSKVESASIGADIGGVLQGKPAVTGLMCSCHCVVT